MDQGEGLWQEAAAGVQASMDADLRDEAYEVFVAEAARSRLLDRTGAARVALRCGITLEGELAPQSDDVVDEHLVLLGADGCSRLIRADAVLRLRGSRPSLRPESDRLPRSLASWLRESWSSDEPIRLLDAAGHWTVGRLHYVGADHIELGHDDDRTVIPMTAVEAWQRG